MASPDINAVLHVPGRLCVNPTSLATAWPHGGTGLGLVGDVVVKPGQASEHLHEESFGVETIDVLDLGEAWTLAATLRSFDSDAVAAVFPATVTGTTSGKTGVAYPGASYRAGTLRSSNSVSLLFTPDDPGRHDFVYFPRAVPLVDEAAELQRQIAKEQVVAVMFVAIRDSSNRVCLIQRKEDLTL